MRTVSKTVYQFSELSSSAKEKALEWYAQHVFSDSSDWENVYSDATKCAAILGIDIATRRTGGPDIVFSGFSSQGDGACFEGRYSYAKGSVKAIAAHAPQDGELLRIAKSLQAIQRKHFYRITAQTAQRGHYMHSGCMTVECEGGNSEYDSATCEEVRQLLRDFADWIYKQLSEENDYQSSEEVMTENIEANEYEFNEDGSRA